VNPVTGIVEIVDVPTVAETVDRLTAADPVDDSHLFVAVSDKDFRQVGVDEDFIPLLRRLATEAELLAISSLLPKAQGDAVLMLADGKTADEVWAALAEDYLLDNKPVDTEDLDAALKRPASQADFVVSTDDKELMALLSSDFEAWRTFLHPAQRAIAERPVYSGPFRLTGGAGTGKTVVAIHRARFLARQLISSGDVTGRILVATYTTSLATNLQRTLKSFCSAEEFKRLHISTVDSLASQTLSSAGVKIRPIDGDELLPKVAQAAAMAALDDLGIDARYLLSEWQQVIIGRDIRSLASYVTSPRPGRGRRLGRPERKQMWEAVSHLTDDLSQSRVATYIQIAARAADHLAGQGEALYRHVIVDEAQDLHPAQWRLLRAAVTPRENDLFIVGDAHQRIYDSRVSLTSIGIETRGRSRRLKINYRTSQQILGWALGILTGEPIDDLDGNVERQVGYRSAFQGPAPQVLAFDSATEEAQFVADQVSTWRAEGVAASAIGVVARTRADLAGVTAAFTNAEVPFADISAAATGGKVQTGTMHSSKGLEFARLIVVGANADRIPLPFAVTPLNEDEVQHQADIQRERCLLYVACTRARDQLIVTSHGAASALLPASQG
jgi:superfamily I DNA/RNA helicase